MMCLCCVTAISLEITKFNQLVPAWANISAYSENTNTPLVPELPDQTT